VDLPGGAEGLRQHTWRLVEDVGAEREVEDDGSGARGVEIPRNLGVHRLVAGQREHRWSEDGFAGLPVDPDHDDLGPWLDRSLGMEVVIEPVVERSPEDGTHGVGERYEVEKR
jgi:hypothetical protein